MTTEESAVISAANEAIELLEAGGLTHPKHAELLDPIRSSVYRLIRRFFRLQKKAVLSAVGPLIRHQLHLRDHVKREAFTPTPEEQSAQHAANAIMPTSLDPLIFSATANQTRLYDNLIQQAYEAAAQQIAEEEGSSAVLSDDALSTYLRENSLTKLTGGFSETSIDQLRTSIADAYLKGGGYDEIVQAIKDQYDGFSNWRAAAIANTETNDAYNAGRYEMASTLSFTHKAWDVESVNPCLICILNVADGWIEIEGEFSSGDAVPTAHVNCACGLSFKTVTLGH